MFREVYFSFSVELNGRVASIDERAHLFIDAPLLLQCEAAMREWVERRNRIFGTEFVARAVLSAWWQDRDGFWMVRRAPDIKWESK